LLRQQPLELLSARKKRNATAKAPRYSSVLIAAIACNEQLHSRNGGRPLQEVWAAATDSLLDKLVAPRIAEHKLLKKVNFLRWKSTDNERELQVLGIL
jgi:hypothetical protein